MGREERDRLARLERLVVFLLNAERDPAVFPPEIEEDYQALLLEAEPVKR